MAYLTFVGGDAGDDDDDAAFFVGGGEGVGGLEGVNIKGSEVRKRLADQIDRAAEVDGEDFVEGGHRHQGRGVRGFLAGQSKGGERHSGTTDDAAESLGGGGDPFEGCGDGGGDGV